MLEGCDETYHVGALGVPKGGPRKSMEIGNIRGPKFGKTM